MNVRRGESEDRVWYRSERFFRADGQWYFSTREGVEVGPYPSRSSAANGLKLYIRYMQVNPMQGALYASARRRAGQRFFFH
ncbi:DUF6316 family protein [Teredinibacter turnerae]|uniref:DUF6316 family protein n=1 Tax=Teredinibacter turnerae TaxID=2426 RepID=UPI00039F577D|nr:DUF6316 family protein [Teredinibacter turnerae]